MVPCWLAGRQCAQEWRWFGCHHVARCFSFAAPMGVFQVGALGGAAAPRLRPSHCAGGVASANSRATVRWAQAAGWRYKSLDSSPCRTAAFRVTAEPCLSARSPPRGSAVDCVFPCGPHSGCRRAAGPDRLRPGARRTSAPEQAPPDALPVAVCRRSVQSRDRDYKWEAGGLWGISYGPRQHRKRGAQMFSRQMVIPPVTSRSSTGTRPSLCSFVRCPHLGYAKAQEASRACEAWSTFCHQSRPLCSLGRLLFSGHLPSGDFSSSGTSYIRSGEGAGVARSLPEHARVTGYRSQPFPRTLGLAVTELIREVMAPAHEIAVCDRMGCTRCPSLDGHAGDATVECNCRCGKAGNCTALATKEERPSRVLYLNVLTPSAVRRSPVALGFREKAAPDRPACDPTTESEAPEVLLIHVLIKGSERGHSKCTRRKTREVR